jgi:LmbE family N-acetylglucosaminyl deacetylase
LKKNNLLVVAHPDDETIFFGGLVQVYRRRPWKIICVTDGNADKTGDKRKKDFFSACEQMKAKQFEMWDFPDRYTERLNVDQLTERLKSENVAEVFTHGALGEYGHPHHQDVCLAVYRSFVDRAIVWSSAYNCFAEKVIRVPRRAYESKAKILARTYFSETNRFARWLPNQNHEGFIQLKLKEVEAVYAHLSTGKAFPPGALSEYAWFEPYFEEFRNQISERPF